MTVPRMVVVSCKHPKRRSYFLLQFCQVKIELVFHESNHIQAFQSHDELLYGHDDVRGHVYGRVSHVDDRDGHGREYRLSTYS